MGDTAAAAELDRATAAAAAAAKSLPFPLPPCSFSSSSSFHFLSDRTSSTSFTGRRDPTVTRSWGSRGWARPLVQALGPGPSFRSRNRGRIPGVAVGGWKREETGSLSAAASVRR